MNITTGWKGVVQRPNEEIAVLVSSCRRMAFSGVTMLYTDRHASMEAATWISDPDTLSTAIDWTILQRHNFAHDDAYPDKKERYQAEALAHQHVPPEALLGVGCSSTTIEAAIKAEVDRAGLQARVVTRPEWYF